MGMRRDARERAVQFLFQYDLNRPDSLEDALNTFFDSQRASAIAEDKGEARWGEKFELPPLSVEETAARLDLKPETVRTRLFRARSVVVRSDG